MSYRPNDPIDGYLDSQRIHRKVARVTGRGQRKPSWKDAQPIDEAHAHARQIKALLGTLTIAGVAALGLNLGPEAGKPQTGNVPATAPNPNAPKLDENGLTPEQAADKAELDAEISAKEKATINGGNTEPIQAVVEQHNNR